MTAEEAKKNNLIDRFLYGEEKGKLFYNLKDYSKDWNLLMEAVEKIESLVDHNTGHMSVEIVTTHCRIYQYDWKERFKANQYKTKLDATYDCVVQFIKWFNTQNQQP